VHHVLAVLRREFPEFRSSWLAKTGIQSGVRETYRIVGEYQLTKDDVVDAKPFPDTVAKGAHVIDIHEPDSIDQAAFFHPRRAYAIPLRCLVPRGSLNLLTAGRSLSADGPGFGSARVMATCMAMGQGAGTAAALCVRHGWSIGDLDTALLHTTLLDQGAIVDLDASAVSLTPSQ
jgi:hypothetical protein